MNGGTASTDGSIAVLICDDDPAIRRMLTSVLALRPSLRLVGEASDGDEVVIEAARLQPDVILLDLAMPHRTGLDALPELRSVAPRARVIVFSGFSMATVAEEAVGLGAVLYLSKGADPDAINDAIEYAAAEPAEPRLHVVDQSGEGSRGGLS
jgi:DNA-binding NarL/FixJ family response regulator